MNRFEMYLQIVMLSFNIYLIRKTFFNFEITTFCFNFLVRRRKIKIEKLKNNFYGVGMAVGSKARNIYYPTWTGRDKGFNLNKDDGDTSYFQNRPEIHT